MTTAERPLEFYFDFISPFAYLGWTQVHDLARRHGRPVLLKPILFAALLHRYGHKGPAEIAPKRLYTWKYASRLAHDLGVPLAPPPAHPFNPLLALRIASLPLEADVRRQVIDRLFASIWRTGEGATDPAVVARVLDGLSLDGREIVEGASSEEAKRRVRADTDAALETGVFGVPTVIVDGELFWGQDSFPHVERFLRGEDPIDLRAVEVWANIPVGAQRQA